MSTEEWIKMWYIHIHAATWMDLESVTLSEVRQKRRTTIKKIQMNLLTKQKETHSQT